MPPTTLLRALALPLLLAFFASGCADSDGPRYPALEVDDPVVEGPLEGNPVLLGTLFKLADIGYQQAEFFFSGTAHAYRNDNTLASDGRWRVRRGESADYKTRLVVYRPIDPLAFNGTVLVEWMNVTAGADGPVEWTTAHTELVRRGYAWVGVSAQAAGIEGGELVFDDAVSAPLKEINPERYGSLSHPGDSFAYDIFLQALQAVRYPRSVAPLGDLQAQRIIVAGESQSAFYLTTLVNALGRRTDLADAYFIHSRGGGSAPLSQAPQEFIPAPPVVRFRDDLGKPLLNLQTETDLFLLGSAVDEELEIRGSVEGRQEDSEFFRLWEVAGTAHADLYLAILGRFDTGNDPGVAAIRENASPAPGFIECDRPVNSGPQHFVVKAAIAALNRWLVDGEAPTSAERLVLNSTGDGFEFDEYGNVLGGVRTPYVDAPIAIFSGEGQGALEAGVCSLFGTTQFLSWETLASLYPDPYSWVVAVTDAAGQAVENGFLVAEDAELIVESAAIQMSPAGASWWLEVGE
ncbi:alpha/beta hydrolase domain-containing protein [Haliea sp. E17]|uniref:alpha/beta hydrolase domain-containing protein n=1 Tax=Haliea sp. E17 TaxID=3401576 RepID=UPI003AAFD4EA